MAKGKKNKKQDIPESVVQSLSSLTTSDTPSSSTQETTTVPVAQDTGTTVVVPDVEEGDGNVQDASSKEKRKRPPRSRGKNKTAAAQSTPGSGPEQQSLPSQIHQPMPPHGQPMPPHGQPMPPHGQPMPYHGQQMPPHGQPMPHHGQPMPYHGQQMPPHGQPMPYHGQQMPPHGQPMPHHGQPMPYHGQQMPPHGQPMPYHAQQMPPHGQPMPLHGQPMPHHGQPMPPHGQPMPPHGQPMPLHGQPMPPHGQPMPHHGQQMPPHGQPMSPHGQPMPLHGQPMPPHGQPMTPHGQPMPPHGQPMPPHAQPKTPHGQQKTPRVQPVQHTQQATGSSQQVKKSTPTEDSPKGQFVIPPRYDTVTLPSTSVRLLTNYLLMKINPQMKCYRYDIGFKPDRPKKALPLVFQKLMQEHYPKLMLAFDQVKNFYSVSMLPGISETSKFEKEVSVQDDNGKTMKFEVSVKFTGVIEFKALVQYMKDGTSLNPPTEVIQCVDVVLRQGTLQSYVKAGRTFFKRPRDPIDLGGGLEMWTGLFQSAIFTTKPYINIDVAHKGFPIQQPLLALVDSMRLDPRRAITSQRGYGVELFNQYIKGLRVVARVGGDGPRREYICNGLVKPPRDIRFTMEANGKKRDLTVYEYFTQEKKCRLQYPDQNCMWVGPRNKNIFYPMELLEVSYGQVRNRQLNEEQLRTMVREAATPPDVRHRKINEIIKDMNYPSNPYFKHFGLEISDKFSAVTGRVLPAPQLDCGAQRPVNPVRGVWNPERLQIGSRLERWAVLCLECDVKNTGADQLEGMFQNEGRRMGITVEKLKRPPAGNVRVTELKARMEQLAAEDGQLLLVVVSSRGKDLYSQVKKIAELNVGLLTQCIKDQTCQRRLNSATVRNILLKVNSKLRGVNQSIHPSCRAKPMCSAIMMVGADVTHPSPDQTNIPSIAAVCASIDTKCFKYNVEISIQAPKEEMIRDFEGMMESHLRVFQRELKCLPKRIYVFRDGVSEGQFAQVLDTELSGVYRAYSRVSGGAAAPEVLFVLVQKRHHTRFFDEKSDRNVVPGTVVDTDIVHPRELDFYLVSHAAIKGTSRPARYHCVANTGAAAAHEVQQTAYQLCHLFSRCARAVSLPAPTYYAHLACSRAKALTLGDTFDFKELEKQPKRLNIKSNLHENNPMFFV